MAQKEHIGIDFGTTNISITKRTVGDVIKPYTSNYEEDSVPFPSILSISCSNNELTYKYGRKVKSEVAKLEKQGELIIKSLKTEMADAERTYRLCDREIPIVDVVCGLMKGIKEFVRLRASDPTDITEATVAVPVDFSLAQRRLLKEAFDNAGIRVNGIISESTAAYISNRKYVEGLSNVMVFDWGGGTLDISLLNINKKEGLLHELATTGWAVAGDKIDEEIAENLHKQIVNNAEYKVNVSFSELTQKDRIKILSEAEKVKINFSDENNVDEPQIVFMLDYCGEKSVRCDFDYETFCAIINPFIDKAVGQIQTVLNEAKVSVKTLGAIIMVGGSSNLLPLRWYMDEEFRKRHGVGIVYPEKVQWSVSEGAAIIDSLPCAYSLNQEIGLEMCDGTVFRIVEKGAQIPCERTASFGVTDNAESANFIFRDDQGNKLWEGAMQSKGYDDERFMVKVKIGLDLVAEVTLDNVYKMANTYLESFELRKLSLCYDISQIDKHEEGE